MKFADRYGPWAVIAGASEGTGRAFALQLAAQGVHCILLARRVAPLTTLADEIRARYRVECVTARSEEHTSELQSLMRISYAVFCLNQKKNNTQGKIAQGPSHHKRHTRRALVNSSHEHDKRIHAYAIDRQAPRQRTH